MEYTTLGSTGIEVSRICLGCMSFGSPDWREWVLDEAESQAILERAMDLGINFFDTANMYSTGESERILGNFLADYDRREQVIATKGYFDMGEGQPNRSGLSRKAIEQELAASRERLGIDTVDLYQIHRWDGDVPIETTLRALDDAVRRGHIRHAGASSMYAYQFADALHTSEREQLSSFETMQNHYNLVYREEEREMLPLCAREDIAVLPWSPLARGYLTRPHDQFGATDRGAADEHARDHPYRQGGGERINDRVAELAIEYDASMAQIALAWVLAKDVVTAPIVGTTSVAHLEEAVAALELSLAQSDIEWLEAAYEPVRVSGHG
jgi:aryl-alcohol dehydrogenase-like predicted oxidoreductase